MSMQKRTADGPTGRAVVRSLHLLALAAYVLASVFPPLASPTDPSALEVRVSALGIGDEHGADPTGVVLWMLLAAAVAGALMRPSSRVWGSGSVAVGGVIGIYWWATAMDPPSLLWDGRLPDGRPTGGMLVAEPTWALGAVALTVASLTAGGLCSFVRGRVAAARTVPPAS